MGRFSTMNGETRTVVERAGRGRMWGGWLRWGAMSDTNWEIVLCDPIRPREGHSAGLRALSAEGVHCRGSAG